MTTKTVLKSLLRSRISKDGRMSVPNHKLQGILPRFELEKDGLVLRLILPREKEKVRQLILNNFYENAPIPKALKLRQTWPKFAFLEDELNLMMDSGASFVSVDLKSGKDAKIIGANVNTLWKVDENHEAFQVDPLLWLNTAQEIALEETNDILYQTVIWRDFQYQLIYHLCQTSAIQSNEKFILYGGLGYTEPHVRNRGLVSFFRKAMIDYSKSPLQIAPMFVGTIPGFREATERKFPDSFEILADVAYKTINLKAFQKLNDGMILMRTK